MTTPTFFGRYQLLHRLATGGMAEVFLAQTVSVSGFEKELVIKRILPEFSGDQIFEKMFVDEARIAAKLHHPNIVQVFDFDLVEGCYYIAMEYIEGRDLSTIMDEIVQRKERISLSESLYVVREVAKALDYAHRRQYKGKPLNIVHRDISPHNVMISYEGTIKLTDFGIAKAASRLSKTKEGVVKGKLAYMSPEQARGEPLDQRSDLFSLGTIFYELVTLKKLFLGQGDREVLLKVMNPNVASPRSVIRDLPFDVEAIILKLLQRKPANRYADASELLGDLGKLTPQFSGISAADLAWRHRMETLFPQRLRREQWRTPGSWPSESESEAERRKSTGTPILSQPAEYHTPRPTPSLPLESEQQPDWSDDRDTEPKFSPAEELRTSSASSSEGRRIAVRGEDIAGLPMPPAAPSPPRRDQTRPSIGHLRRQRVVTTDKRRYGTALFKRKTILDLRSRLTQEEGNKGVTPPRWLAWLLAGVGLLTLVVVLLVVLEPWSPPPTTGPAAQEPSSPPGLPQAGEVPTETAEEGALLFDGTLLLSSSPPGARVYMNGIILPEPTPVSISLPLHEETEFRIELDGYPTRFIRVTLTDNAQPVEYVVNLETPPAP